MSSLKSSKELLNELMEKNISEAQTAKNNGEIVAWSNAIAPQELLETFGIKYVCTESHAALLGAKKQAQVFIDHSESNGYSIDICSYAKVNIGYSEIMESPAGNIPQPDLLFCCSNICNTAIQWYENIAKEKNIPIILFDMPFNQSYDVPERSIKYIRDQFDEAILRLEQITGKKFSQKRLKSVMKISAEVATWWEKAMQFAANRPSPVSGFDLFNYMGAMVSLRGKKTTLDLLKLWVSELQDKVSRGEGVWADQEEKFRVLWDGIVCWPSLGNTAKVLKKYSINMVSATYPASFPTIYSADDLDSMARAYCSNYVNCNLDYLVDNLCKLVRECSIDGIIYHSNRSCKLMDFRQYEVQRRVQEKTGVASVIVDGDQTDTRSFSLAQYETRVQALVEMMENSKNVGEKAYAANNKIA